MVDTAQCIVQIAKISSICFHWFNTVTVLLVTGKTVFSTVISFLNPNCSGKTILRSYSKRYNEWGWTCYGYYQCCAQHAMFLPLKVAEILPFQYLLVLYLFSNFLDWNLQLSEQFERLDFPVHFPLEKLKCNCVSYYPEIFYQLMCHSCCIVL